MKRLTDKQLHDEIEAMLFTPGAFPGSQGLIAYAQLRALERLADNVFNLERTLAVIRQDHAPKIEFDRGRGE